VLVRYLVDRQWPGGFGAQVQVVNNGTRPIAGWQMVIALPGDTVTSVWKAGGFVSNDILLLQPAETDQVVPPGGGTLNVFFVAEGIETVPAACAFNGIPCG
jgi:cellulase/cellobiase CelA1